MEIDEIKYRAEYKRKYGSTKNASKSWKRLCVAMDRIRRRRKQS
jgi:hypothetical protein|tara:strand:+ start:288 stop:419 length:132 start_codon:yes stop_codon:yes gene_type:complete